MKLAFHTGGGSTAVPIWALGKSGPVRVLLIDDDEDEVSLTRSLLARVTDVPYDLDWTSTFGGGIEAIERDEHDAYIIDHQLGARTGVELVREARSAGSLAALIMMTGQRDRSTDLAAMDAGATDFLLKGKTDAALLDRTLRYAISQAAMVSALDRSRKQLAGLEEIGRVLVDDGPTRATILHVVDLIVERFSLRQVAIYLADGDMLHLAGQRGYDHALPSVRRSDSSVERVVRGRQPVFVPSLSPDLGTRNLGSAIASELSVPLMVGGELMGLLNVASLVSAPIGEQDYAAIRLVADRVSAALAITRERRIVEERLSTARHALRASQQTPAEDLMIGETSVYRRAMLEPLLQVAIAGAGAGTAEPTFGLLLVGCEDAVPEALTTFIGHTRTVFANHAIVGFAATELAVLMTATNDVAARVAADDLIALARRAGLHVSCGYAGLESGWGPAELIAAAEAALAYARRIGPGMLIR